MPRRYSGASCATVAGASTVSPAVSPAVSSATGRPGSETGDGAAVFQFQLGLPIYNQNQGAKAVLECIFGVLPAWFVDEAEQICRNTLQNGDGTPLAKRIEQCVDAFAGIQVNASALEKRVGRPRAKWEAQDLASLLTSYQSIQRGEMRVEDEFDTGAQAAATGDLTARVNRATGEVLEEQA